MLSVFRLRARFLAPAILFVCSATAPVASQQIASQSESKSVVQLPHTPLFKSNVRRVVVDVMVSDPLGQPVSNLTREDFSIVEDGKLQSVRAFDVHNFDPISDLLPEFPNSLPANTFVNVPRGPERGPLYALLLDLLNMDTSEQPVARTQLWEFIRNKPLGTRFAVFVLSDRLYMVQGFTENRDVLAQALDPKNSHSRIPRIFLYADNFRPYISTPAMLAQIANYLADFPGHKNLIWLSDAFPSVIMPSSDPNTEALSVSDQVKEATDSLARGQIAVYPIDVRGVVARFPSSSSPMLADAALNATYMTEDEIAHDTGGRAFHSTNDLAGALAEATEVGGRYYTLTYSPTNENYDGRLRHIKVELSKRGYRLDYRRSYYGNAAATAEPAKEKRSASDLMPLELSKPSNPLASNMQHGAPLTHQLLFRAHMYTLAPPAKATSERTASLATQASLRDPGENEKAKHKRTAALRTYQIDYTIAARYPALEIAAVAYDGDGKVLNAADERVVEERAQIPEGKTEGAIYRVQQKFDVPLNATSVRLAVRDIATDNVGALEINLPLAPETPPAGNSGHLGSRPDALDP